MSSSLLKSSLKTAIAFQSPACIASSISSANFSSLSIDFNNVFGLRSESPELDAISELLMFVGFIKNALPEAMFVFEVNRFLFDVRTDDNLSEVSIFVSDDIPNKLFGL